MPLHASTLVFRSPSLNPGTKLNTISGPSSVLVHLTTNKLILASLKFLDNSFIYFSQGRRSLFASHLFAGSAYFLLFKFVVQTRTDLLPVLSFYFLCLLFMTNTTYSRFYCENSVEYPYTYFQYSMSDGKV